MKSYICDLLEPKMIGQYSVPGLTHIKGNKLDYVQGRVSRMERRLETMSPSHGQHELNAYCVPNIRLSTGNTEISKSQPFDFED